MARIFLLVPTDIPGLRVGFDSLQLTQPCVLALVILHNLQPTQHHAPLVLEV
jgi:hypothetical protein